MQQEVSIDNASLVLLARKSNALDLCLLMEGLVTLFKAYESACPSRNASACPSRNASGAPSRDRACDASNAEQLRLSLAAAICHGVSPDPELFLVRLDLLAPYTMIEHLFIASGENGQAQYTAAGLRHLELLHEYEGLLERLAQPLYEDCQKCKPVEGSCSPYGVLYGFSSNLLELMAFKTLQSGPTGPFSLEDIFTEGSAEKRAWVNEWRKLPHIKPEITKQFEYSEDFAQALHLRVEQAFQDCLSLSRLSRNPLSQNLSDKSPKTPSDISLTNRVSEDKIVIKHGRLFIFSGSAENSTVQQVDELARVPELPMRYSVASDQQQVDTHKAEPQAEGDLLHCRLEGEFLVSYKTPGGWRGITKDLLTEVLGAGKDVKVTGLTNEAAQVLSLMCPNLAILTPSTDDSV